MMNVSCAYLPSVYVVGEMSIQVFCPFSNQVVCFLGSTNGPLYFSSFFDGGISGRWKELLVGHCVYT